MDGSQTPSADSSVSATRRHRNSVNDLVFRLLELEVRDVESPDALERGHQGRIDLASGTGRQHVSTGLPEEPQHPRPIKPLSLTVFAKGHVNTTLVDTTLAPREDQCCLPTKAF